MRILVLFLLLPLFLSATPTAQQFEGWRGITPLRSSVSGVRAKLGKPSDRGVASELYILSDFKVNIRYSAGPCKPPFATWNVKKGTVLTILVVPLVQTPFDIKASGTTTFERAIKDDLSIEYTNLRDGIKYTVSPDGNVSSILFTPPDRRRSQFACK